MASAVGTAATEDVTWNAVSTAVALLARQQFAPDVPRQVVLGDVAPDDALVAMETITGVLLAYLSPHDQGALMLERIGLAALEQGASRQGRDGA